MQKWASRWDGPGFEAHLLHLEDRSMGQVCRCLKKRGGWNLLPTGHGAWQNRQGLNRGAGTITVSVTRIRDSQRLVKNPQATRFDEDIIVSFSLISRPNPLLSTILGVLSKAGPSLNTRISSGLLLHDNEARQLLSQTNRRCISAMDFQLLHSW